MGIMDAHPTDYFLRKHCRIRTADFGFLAGKKVDIVIIACKRLLLLLGRSKGPIPIPVLGVIKPGVRLRWRQRVTKDRRDSY